MDPNLEQRSDLSSPDFATRELGHAAYLSVLGHTPQLKFIHNDAVAFEFDGSPELHEAINRYARGTALVDPAAYELTRRKLLREISEVKRQGRR